MEKRTVDIILDTIYPARLRFNREERRFFIKNGQFNGIGAAGGINFGTIFRHNIPLMSGYDPLKLERFIEDCEKLSCPHDAEYYNGNRFLYRFIADYRFAKSIAMLCKSWSSRSDRFWIFAVIFGVLIKKGGAAFNYGSKKDIKILFPKVNMYDFS